MDSLPEKSLESSKDQIRLLHILPRQNLSFFSLGWIKDYFLPSTPTRQISCTIETTSLLENLRYLALSYNSGDPTLSKQILINGKNVPITEDLHTALQHIQHETQAVTIWIEALCTDQNDDEKANQVANTKDIYQETDLLLVWLGLAADGSDWLLENLSRIGRACDDLELPVITTQTLLRLSRSLDEPYSQHIIFTLEQLYQKFDYLFPDQFPFEAYGAFLARAWWRRVEAVEELAGASDAGFWCGEKVISYKHLCNAHTFLRGYCWSEMGRPKFPDSPFDQEDTAAFEAVMNKRVRYP